MNRYVIITTSPVNGRTLLLADLRKNPKAFWTRNPGKAFIYSSFHLALERVRQLKHNNPQIISFDEAVQRINQESVNDPIEDWEGNYTTNSHEILIPSHPFPTPVHVDLAKVEQKAIAGMLHNSCSNCIHWEEATSNTRHSIPYLDAEKIHGWSWCTKMTTKLDNPIDPTTLAMGADHNSYASWVRTHETFLCSMYEENLKAR